MANLSESSDHGHSTSPSSDSEDLHWLARVFTPDRLSSIRGVISVLLDVGRLIDRGMAMWHHYGMPMLRHV